jgi:hypothetical protein
MSFQDVVLIRVMGADCWGLNWPPILGFYLVLSTPFLHATHTACTCTHIYAYNWFLISLCWRGIKLRAGENYSQMESCSGRKVLKDSLKKTLSPSFRQTRSVKKQLRLPSVSRLSLQGLGNGSSDCDRLSLQWKGRWGHSSAQLGDFMGEEMQAWKES